MTRRFLAVDLALATGWPIGDCRELTIAEAQEVMRRLVERARHRRMAAAGRGAQPARRPRRR